MGDVRRKLMDWDSHVGWWVEGEAGVAGELAAGDEVLEPAAVVAGDHLAVGLVHEDDWEVADGAGSGLVSWS